MLPICHVSAFCRRISFTNVRWCIVGALRRCCFPMGKTTGRMISAPTRTVQPNFICKMFGIALLAHLRRRCFPMGETTGRMISAPTRTVQPNFICKMFGIALSAHLRRRCFPMGKTTGRILSVALWCDRPRRSLDFDSLRGAPPYADVPHRTRCVMFGTLTTIAFVGADSIRPPTWQVFEQNRFGRTGFRCCKMHHDST